MLHVVPPPTQVAHRHQVEPVLIPRAPVPEPPPQRHPLDQPALDRADRFDRRPAAEGAASLHLDERDQAAPPHYQVEIMAADSEAVRFHLPAARYQEAHRRSLAGETT